MAKILAIVTDETVRENIRDAIRDMTDDKMLSVPDDKMAEFEDECVDEIIYTYELHERDLIEYRPDYSEVVLDIAKSYGYLL